MPTFSYPTNRRRHMGRVGEEESGNLVRGVAYSGLAG